MSATSTAGPSLWFCTDPGEFLAAAGEHLAAAPVVSTVVAGYRPVVDMANLVIVR
ncbi:hypothetical protein [Micromonospora eburnea]|nr:hypothetical protein [Micromonospora eburnea]